MNGFLTGPVAKHLAMLGSDLHEKGLTWKVWQYLPLLVSQHMLVYASIAIGALSVPPFAYIFGVGVKGLEQQSLSTVANAARDLLNYAKPLHLGLTYFVATLIVASVFHHIGKGLINWLELGGYIRDRNFRNLKTSTLNLLHAVENEVGRKRVGDAMSFTDRGGDSLKHQLYALSFYHAGVGSDYSRNRSGDSSVPSDDHDV
jgi:hypothetical protein